jgi:membrane protein DedA with SNARE-associated domain
LRQLVRRFGGLLFLNEEDLDRAEAWFDRHGDKAVLIGRLIPVVRSLISIPAGLIGMPLGRFVVYTAIGSGLWNGILAGLGWVLGERWQLVVQYSRYLQLLALIILAAAIIWLIWRRWQRRR